MNFFPGKAEKKKEQLVEQTILKKYNSYYRLAYSYVHQEADAEDIVQNTAYHALRACNDLRNPEYVETWMYRILMNEIFKFLKHSDNVSYEDYIENNENVGGVEDTYEDVDLMRAIDQLPPKDKLVVELRYFEDRKLEDISLILEENVSTVKSRLYRSLKKMRIMLDEEE